jgi:hypothetical protein
MEQKSDVEFRAEKLYKNSREKFGYVLREVIANAIHSTIILLEKKKEPNYKPSVNISFEINEKNVEIEIEDNGEGFTEFNRKYFTHLDSKNSEKMKLNLYPQGQGRLSILYFSDSASYSSVFRDTNGIIRETIFPYPQMGISLFDIENGEGEITKKESTGTTLNLRIVKQQTLGRAKTFFSKYDTKDKLYNWFIDNFFPFFMEYPSLDINVIYLSDTFTINKSNLEKTIDGLPFNVEFNGDGTKTDFKVWIIDTDTNSKKKGNVICYARHLQADLGNGKLEYEIDLPSCNYWIVTSEHFDTYVDSKGDTIEISDDDIQKIQLKLNFTLDEHYKEQIEKNKKETKVNIESAISQFHSLKDFIEKDVDGSTKKVLKEADIISNAIEKKGKVEKVYWINKDTESEDVNKLINSSLHIYVAHRNRVLTKFHDMIKRFDDNGDYKTEPEDDIHDLFLKRGAKLSTSTNINHLHNLWILDDKYTVFSETKKALSSKRGQELSDIYLWIDDPEKINELLILELKSTTNAHNAGDKYESMVAQVKRYAAQFYKEPSKILDWDIDPQKILFSGIILARKSDINKELNSNNASGNVHKIPFLDSSYFYNENFSIANNDSAIPVYKGIRIELLSFEDVHDLAKTRNKVFFNLLNGEYKISDET